MKYKTLKLGLLLASLCGLVSATSIAYVPKAAPGNTAAAGAGEEWPTTRFIVNGDCVTDNLTGLMWAKNANLFNSSKKWQDGVTYPAQEAIDAMNGSNPSATGYHLCGYSDWRLPNQKELLSLLNYAAASGNSQNWLATQNFTNVQTRYWSSTTYDNSNTWVVQMNTGTNNKQSMSGSGFVWPVRGGQ